MPNHDGVQISCVGNRATVHLKSWLSCRLSPGAAAPNVPGQFRILHLAPGEWLAVSDGIGGPALHRHLESYTREESVAAVDVSQGFGILRVAGKDAREVLSKGCGLDLHPRLFPAGYSTRTRFAQLPVIMECSSTSAHFDLYVARSYSTYLLSWLCDSASAYLS